ncbi:aromatic amino acid transport family protein [Rickettsia endosymbiont of Cardiosporidium cionae]|uniref:aromatic amino acid transport family protein n=1 Tax=Rickettsia endosymbiont of Cardiosporidium cionae TaxID=2777155 RepID=UPI001894D3E8|nr:aromatic amino acid transport family protein [Rickettsia endosymbiont of Cardiosporidium cionae]KAF8818969.1 amino acid permease [Rickettsia endosymbiont of Cardiosporidium cionae]
MYFQIVNAVLMILGTAVGAGMLGLPLSIGRSGFIISAITTVAVWYIMFCTGIILSEVVVWNKHQDQKLPSIVYRFLGKKYSVLVSFIFLFLYYCLMIAYFAAGVPILGELLSIPNIFLSYIIFLCFFIVLIYLGEKLIGKSNILMSLFLCLILIILITIQSRDVIHGNLINLDFANIFVGVPILFGAFGYHNIIPYICRLLDYNTRYIRISIFSGTMLVLLIYIAWEWVIIGSIDKSLIEQYFFTGSSIALVFKTDTIVALLLKYFAIFAISTSMLGVAFSVLDFLNDSIFLNYFNSRYIKKHLILTLIVLIPPCVLAMFNPDIFYTILGIAGGFGEIILNGILPVILFYYGHHKNKLFSNMKYCNSRNILKFFTTFFLLMIILEFYNLFH